MKLRHILFAALLGFVFAEGEDAGAKPFYEHTESLLFAYATELIEVRLTALAAVSHLTELPKGLVEQAEKLLEHDLPLFAGSLAAKDPGLLEALETALIETVALVQAGRTATLEAAIENGRVLTRQARITLVPREVSQTSAFTAALVSNLLLADDGVAETYEDAAEGEVWEYPGSWAALQHVKSLWAELESTASEEQRAEIEEALEHLDSLFPSPEPPSALLGDPEEAEEPAHRVVALLERITGADLYPGRDFGRVATLIATLVQRGCEAYATSQERLGHERIMGARFFYDEALSALVSVLAPERDHEVQMLFSSFRATLPPGEAQARCDALSETLERVRRTLGG
jgi:hypothetical protein